MKKKIHFIIVFMICLLLAISFSFSPRFIFDIVNPQEGLFVKNDSLYLNTSTFELFKKNSNEWNKLGSINSDSEQSIFNIYINEDGFVVIDGEVTKIKLNGLKGDSGKDGKDGKNGINGKDGKDGNDGIVPTFETSNDGKLIINDIKTSIRVEESKKVCEFISDLDNDFEFSVGDEIKCGSEYFYVFSIYDNGNFSISTLFLFINFTPSIY